MAKRGPKSHYLPDTIVFRVAPGVRDKVGRAARALDMSPSEWLRRSVRLTLENERKREERRRAALRRKEAAE